MSGIEQFPQSNNQMAAVQAIMARCMAMGANDYERSAFEEIMKKLSSGAYTNPDDAVRDAENIVNSKQDYH